MGYKVINDLSNELMRRIEQLSPEAAEAAIMRALCSVHDSGSYTFDLTGTYSQIVDPITPPGESATTGVLTMPANADLRKAMFVANANGLPIIKAGVTHLWETYAMNIPIGEIYGTYTISGRTLLLRPGNAQTVGVRYHVMFAPLAGNQNTKLTPYLDELVIDLAEAKERQIFSVGDVWIRLQETTMAAIVKNLDGFLSVSQQQMPLMEAAQAAHEATQLGRA